MSEQAIDHKCKGFRLGQVGDRWQCPECGAVWRVTQVDEHGSTWWQKQA